MVGKQRRRPTMVPAAEVRLVTLVLQVATVATLEGTRSEQPQDRDHLRVKRVASITSNRGVSLSLFPLSLMSLISCSS